MVMAQPWPSTSSIASTRPAGILPLPRLPTIALPCALPRVTDDQTQVHIRFQTNVLTYSTNFTAAVRLTTEPGAAQVIDPGPM